MSKKSLLNSKDARSCYICDTPFQLMNCMNWRYFNDSESEADIYIGKHFFDAVGIIQRVKETKLFSHVYFFDFPKYKNIAEYVACKCREVFKIRKALDKWTRGANNLDIKYDRIYLSVYTNFSFGVVQINPYAEIVFYDDGIGTYLGKAQKYDFRKRKLICHVLRLHFPNLDYDSIIVNNKDFYLLTNGHVDYPIKMLHKIELGRDKLLDMLNSVFNYSMSSFYRERRIIYLTQPNDDKQKDYENTEVQILGALKDFKNSLLLRIHPRQQDFHFQDFLLDTKKSMWELVVLNEITDWHILIGLFSTAQFVPKIMFNKEPTLVFTYKLYSNGLLEEEISQMDMMVQKLRNIYINKNKIKVVSNVKEMKEIMNRLYYSE